MTGEALAALLLDGLAEALQGSGVVVAEVAPDAVLPFQNLDPARLSPSVVILEPRTAAGAKATGLATAHPATANQEAIVTTTSNGSEQGVRDAVRQHLDGNQTRCRHFRSERTHST